MYVTLVAGMEEVTKVIAIGAQDDIEVLQEPDHHRGETAFACPEKVINRFNLMFKGMCSFSQCSQLCYHVKILKTTSY